MISIIIPTYNRFEILKETIEKAIGIKTTIVFEIIIINDGNPIPFVFDNPKITLLKNPSKGVSSARNYGAKNAQYDILFFIDDDMWITARTLEIIHQLYKENLLEHSYFNLNWTYPEILQQKLSTVKIGRYILHANYHTLEGRCHRKFDYSIPAIDHNGVGSGSFCILKENFNTVGGYNEQVEYPAEDIDMKEKLERKNISSKIVTEISCFHNQQDRLDIDGYFQRTYTGAFSQAKAGMLYLPKSKQYFYTLFIPFYSIFKFLFKITPNKQSFDKISFRLIGILSSLSYVMAIRNIRNDAKN